MAPSKMEASICRSGTKRELLSLVGLLFHAARVVAPGRAFVRSLIDAASSVLVLDHHVCLSAAARAELCWWGAFLQLWNGICFSSKVVPSEYAVFWLRVGRKCLNLSAYRSAVTDLASPCSRIRPAVGAAEPFAKTSGSSWSGRAHGRTLQSPPRSWCR